MTLQNINIEQLTISPLNVRKYGAKDCDALAASIRAFGVLQPLLVRPVDEGFEVVAGQRRLNACRTLAEDNEIKDIPCLVMAVGDDAAIIEASLAENIERQPMDEVDQFKAFARLISEGREVEDIAASFAITTRMVEQRLALGRLHPSILSAYRKGDIQAGDVRNLTMASLKQQKAWWALFKDADAHAPTGQRVKDWLFGGAHIPTAYALFDVEASGLAIVSDLFGEESYFAEAEAFWTHQNADIAEAVDAYRQKGWAAVTLLETGHYFACWDYRTCPKDEGGHVFVEVSSRGDVTFHEGYITSQEAKRRDKAEAGTAPTPKPELTKAAQNHVDLNRHAAVRADLLGNSGTALRLIAALMIAGSDLWRVEADPQKAAKPEIADSLAGNKGQQAFETEKQAIAVMLELGEVATVLHNRDLYAPRPCAQTILIRLHDLSDKDVIRILTFLMAQSLSVQSDLIDGLAGMMGTDMAQHWQPEDTFFTLIRDKQVLNTMISELAGESVAKANLTETANTHRKILSDCLNGTRTPVTANWMPRHMAFPQGSYRDDVEPKDKQRSETSAAAKTAPEKAA